MTAEQTAPQSPQAAAGPEGYLYRDNAGLEADLARRTAATAADFVLPYLRPGMRLLDCGCGPGAITLDLAKRVAPGSVVGIDLRRT